MQRCCASAHVPMHGLLKSHSHHPLGLQSESQHPLPCRPIRLSSQLLKIRKKHNKWGCQQLEMPSTVVRPLTQWIPMPEHLSADLQNSDTRGDQQCCLDRNRLNIWALHTPSPSAGTPGNPGRGDSSLPARSHQPQAPGRAGRLLVAHIGLQEGPRYPLEDV